MRKLLLLGIAVLSTVPATFAAETIVTNGKTCTLDVLIDRDLGPGIRYTRLRLPEYPLNVNMLRIDVTNPYNSMETTQANDRLYGTETLVNAAKRQTTAGHKAVAGANANFWCVSGQPPFSDILVGLTYNGNVRNGKIISELNMYSDQWNGGYQHTGVVGITEDRKAFSHNNYTWKGYVRTDAWKDASNENGSKEIITVNKTVRANEMGMYNSYYGPTRTFKCVDQYAGTDGKQHFKTLDNVATEVYLTLDDGQKWTTWGDMTFTVKEIKQNAGAGTLNGYDLVLVGRDDKAEALNKLTVDSKITLQNGFYDDGGNLLKVHNLVGGNAQVMLAGEMTTYATSEGYNSQVYSRTGYGVDKDNKTLYIIVIDKSTDPVYGVSAGCSTTVMCDIARHYGCWDMTNFDAGGSAEMFVDGAVINKTTESTPRAVANGMFAYDIAPEDNVVARLEFDDYNLQAPVYTSFSPRILAYNQYGSLINDNVEGFTLSCPAEAGSCDGMTFTASGNPGVSTLTATVNGVSVTKEITIVDAQPSIRIKPILIDHVRKYPMEVTATVGRNVYSYDPASIGWTSTDDAVASVDANGVLTGKKDGKVTLTGNIGEFSDNTEVTVEIPTKPAAAISGAGSAFEEWTTTVTGIKPITLTKLDGDDAMHVEYKITSTRGTKFTLVNKKQLFSLPDALKFVVNPGTVTIKNIVVSLQPANAERPVSVTLTPTLEANKDNEITVPMTEFGNPADLAFYPAMFNSIAFSPGDKTGTYSIDIKSMQTVYNNYVNGISDIVSDTSADAPVELYNLQGIRVSSANAAPGLYIRRQGNRSEKIIIR